MHNTPSQSSTPGKPVEQASSELLREQALDKKAIDYIGNQIGLLHPQEQKAAMLSFLDQMHADGYSFNNCPAEKRGEIFTKWKQGKTPEEVSYLHDFHTHSGNVVATVGKPQVKPPPLESLRGGEFMRAMLQNPQNNLIQGLFSTKEWDDIIESAGTVRPQSPAINVTIIPAPSTDDARDTHPSTQTNVAGSLLAPTTHKRSRSVSRPGSLAAPSITHRRTLSAGATPRLDSVPLDHSLAQSDQPWRSPQESATTSLNPSRKTTPQGSASPFYPSGSSGNEVTNPFNFDSNLLFEMLADIEMPQTSAPQPPQSTDSFSFDPDLLSATFTNIGMPPISAPQPLTLVNRNNRSISRDARTSTSPYNRSRAATPTPSQGLPVTMDDALRTTLSRYPSNSWDTPISWGALKETDQGYAPMPDSYKVPPEGQNTGSAILLHTEGGNVRIVQDHVSRYQRYKLISAPFEPSSLGNITQRETNYQNETPIPGIRNISHSDGALKMVWRNGIPTAITPAPPNNTLGIIPSR